MAEGDEAHHHGPSTATRVWRWFIGPPTNGRILGGALVLVAVVGVLLLMGQDDAVRSVLGGALIGLVAVLIQRWRAAKARVSSGQAANPGSG